MEDFQAPVQILSNVIKFLLRMGDSQEAPQEASQEVPQEATQQKSTQGTL